MALSAGLGEIVEYRGVEGLVAAEVICDDNSSEAGHGYVTGDVFSIAGVATIEKATDSSNETHYYDNMPAVVISSTGADTITATVSAIDVEVLAKITGQDYDPNTGAYIEGQRDLKYFALGYKTKKTNGDEVYVWRYKGTFAVPNSTHNTEDNSTSANNQQLVFTGISTTHKWAATGKGAKAMNLDLGKDLVSEEVKNSFFTTVTDPDDIVGVSAEYTVFAVEGEDTTLTIKKGTTSQTTITNGAVVDRGETLQISVTGGTLTVNGQPFTSGNTMLVYDDVRIVSTKTTE